MSSCSMSKLSVFKFSRLSFLLCFCAFNTKYFLSDISSVAASFDEIFGDSRKDKYHHTYLAYLIMFSQLLSRFEFLLWLSLRCLESLCLVLLFFLSNFNSSRRFMVTVEPFLIDVLLVAFDFLREVLFSFNNLDMNSAIYVFIIKTNKTYFFCSLETRFSFYFDLLKCMSIIFANLLIVVE